MKKACVLVALAAGCVLVGLGQPETKQKPVGSIVMQEKGLGTLAFLKGTWTGTMGEDYVEETWSAAHGDSIIGMFRWQVGGKQTTMWEMLSIQEEDGKPVLRLRHFDAKFEPWQAEAAGIDPLPAAELSANRVLFAADAGGKGGLKSVEYKSLKPGVLAITVSFRDAAREALEFELKKE